MVAKVRIELLDEFIKRHPRPIPAVEELVLEPAGELPMRELFGGGVTYNFLRTLTVE